tara:strand:+ start:124 stop:498 length:375 start_codon:yes stop_codon:yes gene_type:complete
MKLTKNQLRNLIMETILEKDSLLLEGPYSGSSLKHAATFEGETTQGTEGSTPDDEHSDPGEDKEEMIKRALYHMSQQSQQLHDMLQGDENLEPWVQDKIMKSSKTLEAAFKAITYDKGPGQGRQ